MDQNIVEGYTVLLALQCLLKLFLIGSGWDAAPFVSAGRGPAAFEADPARGWGYPDNGEESNSTKES